MGLTLRMISVQHFCENVGYCRVSALYAESNRQRGILVEMVTRFALTLLAIASVYDTVTNDLPFSAKVLVHGTLLIIISSLALSIVLKYFLPQTVDSVTLPQSGDVHFPKEEKQENATIHPQVTIPEVPLKLPQNSVELPPPSVGVPRATASVIPTTYRLPMTPYNHWDTAEDEDGDPFTSDDIVVRRLNFGE